VESISACDGVPKSICARAAVADAKNPTIAHTAILPIR